MKKAYLILLTVAAVLFSTIAYGQKEAKYLMYKAHSYVDNKDKKSEAFDTYVQAMRIAKKKKLVKEIARGMHTCALYLGQEATVYKNRNNPNANATYLEAWTAFKSGEKKLNKKEINPYVMYVASMTALEINKPREAQQYLEYLKRRNFGKGKVYAMLVNSYLQTNPKQANSVLKEGLSKYPDSPELMLIANNEEW